MSRVTLLSVLALFACNTSGDVSVDSPTDSDADEGRVLENAVTVDAMVGHLEALEAIADANDWTRVSTTEGYQQSIDYVKGQLENAGYEVTLEAYDVVQWELLDSDLTEGGSGVNYEVMPYSGGGLVEGTVVPVDVTLPPSSTPNTSTSGCEASDFDSFPAGSIALIQRGSCTFADKADNAAAAGASAVLIFNEGQSDRRGVVEGVLDEQAPADIPVVGVSYATGESWANAAEAVTVTIDVNVISDIAVEHNILAELAGNDPGKVLLVGAHLDSVQAGPGINDNGSGTAFVLESAIQMKQLGMQPERTVRFAWWGAEEAGLIGSWHHVFDEETGEPDMSAIGDVDAYLNFDMLASGNGAAFVSDGDGSSIDEGGVTSGSAEIEGVLAGWFSEQDVPTTPESLYIPSDSWWFVDLGIPTGHVFSGAFMPKTVEQADAFGGEIGVDLDPCYHQDCDTVANLNRALYAQLSGAGAHTIERLAMRSAALLDSGSARRKLTRSDKPRPYGCHDHVKWDR